MQHCEACGKELPTDALFCGGCGRKTSGETELAANSGDAPIEDVPTTALTTSTDSDEPQDVASENTEEEHSLLLASETVQEEEQPMPPLTLKNGEEEQQTQQQELEPTSTIPDEVDPRAEMQATQVIAEPPLSNDTSSGVQETPIPYDAPTRRRARPVSKCLLFFLAGLIVVAGVVVALVGLFHVNVPLFGSSSSAQSNSTSSDILRNDGPSLTASICAKSSTPSAAGTNNGSGFTLFASSGCSTVVATAANSLCLIFPNSTDAAHKYIFDVSNAAIESKPYHLVLGVAQYTGPTTYTDAKHITVGLSEGSTGQNFSWLYYSGNVTINNGEQTGTMDVVLKSVSNGNTIHVVGDWSCGRQIKNT